MNDLPHNLLTVTQTEDMLTLSTQANNALRAAQMHVSQHKDGLLYGQIPGTKDYGIYNESLLFLNAHADEVQKRYATVFALTKPYDEQYSEKYGWTMPFTKTPAFFSNIQYGPFYNGRTQPMGIFQLKQHLDQLESKIRDLISKHLHITPTQDMIVTFFALQMISSSTTTDWHIQPLALNPHLQKFFLNHIHAPLIFAALGAPKHGTKSFGRQTEPVIQAPRFEAVEAASLEPMNLPLALDLLNITYFKTS